MSAQEHVLILKLAMLSLMTQAMPCCRVMGQIGLERGLSAGAAGKYGEGAS